MAESNSICSVAECGKRHTAKGYCATHYARFKKHGSPHIVERRKKGQTHCNVDGCSDPHHAKGHCARHHARFRQYGSPTAGRDGTRSGAPLKWIEEHRDYSSDDCLLWPFEVTHYGYGTVKHKGQKRVASRVMCELAHGDANQAMDAAHSCHNPRCCNPRHLRWATRSENNRDMFDNGTAMCGERVEWWVKLTECQVREIRARVEAGEKQESIALDYPVGQTQVSRIAARQAWGWLD